MTKVFKALSNPHRLELFLKVVAQNQLGEEQVGESNCLLSKLLPKFNCGASTMSHHLKELVNSGLVSSERQGKFLVVKANPELVQQVAKLFGDNPYATGPDKNSKSKKSEGKNKH